MGRLLLQEKYEGLRVRMDMGSGSVGSQFEPLRSVSEDDSVQISTHQIVKRDEGSRRERGFTCTFKYLHGANERGLVVGVAEQLGKNSGEDTKQL